MEKPELNSIVKYKQAADERINTLSTEPFNAKVIDVVKEGETLLAIGLVIMWEGEETTNYRANVPHKSEVKAGQAPYWE